MVLSSRFQYSLIICPYSITITSFFVSDQSLPIQTLFGSGENNHSGPGENNQLWSDKNNQFKRKECSQPLLKL